MYCSLVINYLWIITIKRPSTRSVFCILNSYVVIKVKYFHDSLDYWFVDHHVSSKVDVAKICSVLIISTKLGLHGTHLWMNFFCHPACAICVQDVTSLGPSVVHISFQWRIIMNVERKEAWILEMGVCSRHLIFLDKEAEIPKRQSGFQFLCVKEFFSQFLEVENLSNLLIIS